MSFTVPDDPDIAYLWDMREAAREALSFIKGKTFEEFEAERLLRLAVERELEIIGEAARRVSSEFQADHAEIPWRQLIGQRNVLAHDYGEIDVALIWNVLSRDLPGFVVTLERLLAGKGLR